MTKKLYDEDAYRTEFEAKVLSVTGRDDGGELWDVVLDETLFFPEEGGQTPDKGMIEGYPVVDVQIKEDVITHTLSLGLEAEETDVNAFLAIFHEGKTVQGKIDWRHRFSNMQQHTGEHIVSGLVHKTYGYENVGFHLSDSIVTMDYDGPLTEAQVREIEWQANRVIIKNVEVHAEYPDADTLSRLSYRSKKELSGAIRIVTITGVDVCACCAPHVKSTGEVGLLKVIDVTSYKGGVRLSVLCGFRALLDYHTRLHQVREISRLTSKPTEEIVEAVQTLKEEIGRQKQLINDTGAELIRQKIALFEADPQNAASKNIILFAPECDMNRVRKLINELTERYEGYCGIFCEKTGDPTQYNYIIGSRSADCQALLKQMQEKWNAKGGGKSVMIQGSLTASESDIFHMFRD